MYKFSDMSCSKLYWENIHFYVLHLEDYQRVKGPDLFKILEPVHIQQEDVSPCRAFLTNLYSPHGEKQQAEFDDEYDKLKKVIHSKQVWLKRMRSMFKPALLLLERPGGHYAMLL